MRRDKASGAAPIERGAIASNCAGLCAPPSLTPTRAAIRAQSLAAHIARFELFQPWAHDMQRAHNTIGAREQQCRQRTSLALIVFGSQKQAGGLRSYRVKQRKPSRSSTPIIGQG